MKRDYIYIWAWGRLMSSSTDYIERQIEAAREDGAPKDAIFFGLDKRWHRYSEITRAMTKKAIDRYVAEIYEELKTKQ